MNSVFHRQNFFVADIFAENTREVSVSARMRIRFLEIESASARLRKLRACSRQICPRRKSSADERRYSSLKRFTGEQPRSRLSRIFERRNVRRRGGVRSG